MSYQSNMAIIPGVVVHKSCPVGHSSYLISIIPPGHDPAEEKQKYRFTSKATLTKSDLPRSRRKLPCSPHGLVQNRPQSSRVSFASRFLRALKPPISKAAAIVAIKD